MTIEDSTQTIDHRQLGTTGPLVTSPGLGAMSMSGAYGPTSDDEGIAAIRTYLDAGRNLIDTGDFYGAVHNEMLIGRALAERDRNDVILSVKFGAVLSPDGAFVETGYVRSIGLSEVGAETIRRAAAVAPISDLQIEYSLLTRSIETNGILDACRELGIGITAYGALGKGMLAGKTDGIRAMFPRFQGENLVHNERITSALGEVASAKGITLPQLAIAWVAAQGEGIVPVVGSRTPDQVRATLSSTEVELSSADLAAIAEVLAGSEVRGDRYPTALMAQLDSER